MSSSSPRKASAKDAAAGSGAPPRNLHQAGETHMTQVAVQLKPVDERIARQNPFQKLLGRPEVGALVGAIVLFIFFASVSQTFIQPASFATVLYGSSTIGIMAVGVS